VGLELDLWGETRECDKCHNMFIPNMEGASNNMCANCLLSEESSSSSELEVRPFIMKRYIEGPRSLIDGRWEKITIIIRRKGREPWKIKFGEDKFYPISDFEFRKQNLDATFRRDISDEMDDRIIILQRKVKVI